MCILNWIVNNQCLAQRKHFQLTQNRCAENSQKCFKKSVYHSCVILVFSLINTIMQRFFPAFCFFINYFLSPKFAHFYSGYSDLLICVKHLLRVYSQTVCVTRPGFLENLRIIGMTEKYFLSLHHYALV